MIGSKVLAISFAGVAFLAAAGAATAYSAKTSEAAYLLAGPSTSYPVRAELPAGDELEVRDCHNNWCFVTIGNQSGYINSLYLETTGIHPKDLYYGDWQQYRRDVWGPDLGSGGVHYHFHHDSPHSPPGAPHDGGDDHGGGDHGGGDHGGGGHK